MDTGFDVQSLIGMHVNEALKMIRAAGFTPRIMVQDGESFVGTMEVRPSRVNLKVDNEIVVKANIG